MAINVSNVIKTRESSSDPWQRTIIAADVEGLVTAESSIPASTPSNFVMSIANGGTGGSTAATARQNIGAVSATEVTTDIGSGFVLGVSEGGTGADNVEDAFENLGVQSGSDTNGNYIKFPNGIMICWGSRNNLTGGSVAIPQSFPATFTNTPTVTISTGAGGGRLPLYVEDVTVSGFNYFRPDSNTSTTTWGRYIAMGFWK